MANVFKMVPLITAQSGLGEMGLLRKLFQRQAALEGRSSLPIPGEVRPRAISSLGRR